MKFQYIKPPNVLDILSGARATSLTVVAGDIYSIDYDNGITTVVFLSDANRDDRTAFREIRLYDSAGDLGLIISDIDIPLYVKGGQPLVDFIKFQSWTSLGTSDDDRFDAIGTTQPQWREMWGYLDPTRELFGGAGTDTVSFDADYASGDFKIGKIDSDTFIVTAPKYFVGPVTVKGVEQIEFNDLGVTTVDALNNSPTGSVTISGSPLEYETLTASHTLADADGMGTIQYQWKANSVAISGATSSTYRLTQGEVGKLITVTTSYTDGNGSLESVTSAATATIANVNDLPRGSVTISGPLIEGGKLTASHTLADADGMGTIQYQWKANSVAISGATSSTYRLTQGEVGKLITVTASYTDGNGSLESVTSTGAAAVLNVNNLPTGSVTISGALNEGATLVASHNLIDADGLGSIQYQWKANNIAINGATSSTYTLTQADIGKTISVTASYTDGFGQPETSSSPATAAIFPRPSENNDVFHHSGGNVVVDGGDGLDTFTYQSSLAEHTIRKTSLGYAVSSQSDSQSVDTLIHFERLEFKVAAPNGANRIALDLDGNGGTAAKILGALWGKESVQNPDYVGIILHFLDSGFGYEDLLDLALGVLLGPNRTNDAVAELVYLNLIGEAPTEAKVDELASFMDSGAYTQAAFTRVVADLEINATNIDLVGLSNTGLQYVEYVA